MEWFKMTPGVFKMAECSWSSKAGNNIIITRKREWDIIGNEFTDEEFKNLSIYLTSKNYNKLYDVLLVYYYFKCLASLHAA